MPKIIDSHSHLNFPQFDDDRDTIIARMRKQDIGTVLVGTNLTTSKEVVELAKKHKNMWASVGIHPVSVNEGAKGASTTNGASPTEASVEFPSEEFKKLAQEDKVVAIGECGLDYYRTRSQKSEARSQQKELFVQHIELAQEINLPLILHCRDSHNDVLKILEDYDGLSGTVHFFTGTLEQAARYIDRGFYIGFDGPVTFTDEYDTLIKEVPLECILVETDAPYAAPAPHRGQRNEPAYVAEIVKKIAQIKEVSFDEVAEKTTKNTRELFDI